jgi:transposase
MELPREIRIPAKRRRRQHPSQFKAQVLAEALHPDASVAAVARRHDLNANLVHKWRRETQNPESATPAFIPLPAPYAPVINSQAEVRIEVPGPRGGVTLFWSCDQTQSLAELIKRLS